MALVALSPRGLVDQQAVDAAAQLGAARHDVDDALAVVGFPATDDRHRSLGGGGRNRESDERHETDVKPWDRSPCFRYTDDSNIALLLPPLFACPGQNKRNKRERV